MSHDEAHLGHRDDRNAAANSRRLMGLWLWIILGMASLVALVIWANGPRKPQGHEYFAKQVEEVRAGRSNYLDTYDTRQTDELLFGIRGLAGLQRLRLKTCSVSDDGMASVATLPDLTRLDVSCVNITSAGLARLQQHPKLAEVDLNVSMDERGQWPNVSIADVLALPHLRKLTLSAWTNNWVRSKLPELEAATSLEELILIDATLTNDDLAPLRTKLPNCKVIHRRNAK